MNSLTNSSTDVSELLNKYYKTKPKSNNKISALYNKLSKDKIKGINDSKIKQSLIAKGKKILSLKRKSKEKDAQNILLWLKEDMQSNLSEDEKKITEWLAQLKLLKGIPLKYIIPLHHLLPNENIRFFTIDQQWINSLINGALSIGNNQSQADELHDSYRNNTLLEKANINLHDVHIKAVSKHLLKHFPEQNRYALLEQKLNFFSKANKIVEISGFIMRSDFVKKYKGVRIAATNERGQTCPILSSEIIGDGIKLCLFEGIIHKVTFHENSDSLHYESNYRDEDGKIKINELTKELSEKNSATLANKLLCGPQIFTFELTK